ncbi:MAG: hypothetical protein DBX45_09390 [Oscillospiraceae bacterium]|nr:MAG: hypothetical protein DBX45_09390 [Oscillospiraceae bacterium]
MNCIGLRKSLPLRAAALLCTAAAVLSAAALPLCSAAEVDAGDTPEERAAAVTAVADGIIEWKKLDNGSSADGYLINETYLELAGSTPGDWYQIGLSRLGVEDNYAGYLAVIRDRVEERYRDPGKLSAAKATEWHRIALSVLASGGDPRALGTDESGAPIDLIADGTYNRGLATPLGRQGINGWIWGLIALDSMRYEVPADAYYTRDDIIVEILRSQLTDGGFALSGKTADPDITAMALQALAPYYNSERSYTYKRRATGSERTCKVREVVDEAVQRLSELQLDTGDYMSWGTENVESTDQVTVALCCLGIDPLTDERFIKNGNTLLDGILRYRMPDGGFVHSYTFDSDNPTSLPDKSNTMASEQTLYTMAALRRQGLGERTLYDFRPEQSSALRERISELSARIGALTGAESAGALEELMREYYSLPDGERSYVYNYCRLSDAAAAAGVDIAVIADTTEVIESPGDGGEETVILSFTAADRAAVDELPQPLTTEQYVTVTTLLDKLECCEAFDGREDYITRLTSAKAEIAAIQAEIDSINEDIRDQLYPFDELSLGDKGKIDAIVDRYNALSEYDRAKIARWEDVVKSKTKVDNLLRALIIGAVCAVVLAVTAVLLVRRLHKRRHRRQTEMEQLAAMYNDSDTL